MRKKPKKLEYNLQDLERYKELAELRDKIFKMSPEQQEEFAYRNGFGSARTFKQSLGTRISFMFECNRKRFYFGQEIRKWENPESAQIFNNMSEIEYKFSEWREAKEQKEKEDAEAKKIVPYEIVALRNYAIANPLVSKEDKDPRIYRPLSKRSPSLNEELDVIPEIERRRKF